MSTAAEMVLVVPTPLLREAGLFQGFSPDLKHYLPRLLDPRHLAFRPRAAMETDPEFKQLIPYVVLKWRDQLFHYTRGQKGSETRLRALRSVGVGGHINPCDADGSEGLYRQGMLREIQEEVHLETAFRERTLGLINDDSTPVGQVHLGIVHVFELEEPKVRRREEHLAREGFAPLRELQEARGEFETWSQFVLDQLTGCANILLRERET